MLRFLMSILALLVLGYLGFCVFLWWNQERLLFFPNVATPAELEEVARTEGFEPWNDTNGHHIGWKSIENADASRALLVFHGNGGYALHRNYTAFRKSGAPVEVFLLEYPGYGSRTGVPSEKSLTAAAIDAIDAIPKDKELFVFGQSLGTGVACAAVAQRPDRVAGVALLTPFNTLVATAQVHYPWLPVALLIRHRFDSVRNLGKYHGPVAFIVAENDGTIPANLGRQLFDGYQGPRKLWFVSGANHNDIEKLLADWPQVASWITSADNKAADSGNAP